jgi:hypothetical protein
MVFSDSFSQRHRTASGFQTLFRGTLGLRENILWAPRVDSTNLKVHAHYTQHHRFSGHWGIADFVRRSKVTALKSAWWWLIIIDRMFVMRLVLQRKNQTRKPHYQLRSTTHFRTREIFIVVFYRGIECCRWNRGQQTQSFP